MGLYGAGCEYGITDGAIALQHGLYIGLVLVLDEIDLVEDQGGANPGQLGCDQVLIDEFTTVFRRRGRDHQDLIEVGCHRLALPCGIGPRQFIASWQARGDHPTFAGALPDDPIADHQRWQILAQQAATCLALSILYLQTGTEVSDH